MSSSAWSGAVVPLYRLFLRRLRDLERSRAGSVRVRDGLRSSWHDSFDAWWDADAREAGRRLAGRRLPWLPREELCGEWTIDELRGLVRAAFRGRGAGGEASVAARAGAGARALASSSRLSSLHAASSASSVSASTEAAKSARTSDAERISSGARAASSRSGLSDGSGLGSASLPASRSSKPLGDPVPLSSVPAVSHDPFSRFPGLAVPTATPVGYHLPPGWASKGGRGTVQAEQTANDGADGAVESTPFAASPSSPLSMLSSSSDSLGWISIEPAVQDRPSAGAVSSGGPGSGSLEPAAAGAGLEAGGQGEKGGLASGAGGDAASTAGTHAGADVLRKGTNIDTRSATKDSEIHLGSVSADPQSPGSVSADPQSPGSVSAEPTVSSSALSASSASSFDSAIASLRELETQTFLARASRVTRSSRSRGLEIDATAFGPVRGAARARHGAVVLRTRRVDEEITGSVLRGMRDLGRMLRLGGERKARGLRVDPTWVDRLGTRSLVALAEIVLLINRDEEAARFAEAQDRESSADAADPSAPKTGTQEGLATEDAGAATAAASVLSSSLSFAPAQLPPGVTWERLLALVPAVRSIEEAVQGGERKETGQTGAGAIQTSSDGHVEVQTEAAAAAQASSSQPLSSNGDPTFSSPSSSSFSLSSTAEDTSTAKAAAASPSSSSPLSSSGALSDGADAHAAASSSASSADVSDGASAFSASPAPGAPEVQDVLTSALTWDGSSDVFGGEIGGFVSPEVDAALLRLGGYETDDEWIEETSGGHGGDELFPPSSSSSSSSPSVPAPSLGAPSAFRSLPCFPLDASAPPLARPPWAMRLDLPRAARRRALRRPKVPRRVAAMAAEAAAKGTREGGEDALAASSVPLPASAVAQARPLPPPLSQAASRALSLTRRPLPPPSERARQRSWSRGGARRFFVVGDPAEAGRAGAESTQENDVIAPQRGARSTTFAGHHRRERRRRLALGIADEASAIDAKNAADRAGTGSLGIAIAGDGAADEVGRPDDGLPDTFSAEARDASPHLPDALSSAPGSASSSAASNSPLVTLYDASELDALFGDEPDVSLTSDASAASPQRIPPLIPIGASFAPSPALPSISLHKFPTESGSLLDDASLLGSPDAPDAPLSAQGPLHASALSSPDDSDLDAAFAVAASVGDEDDDEDTENDAQRHIVRLRFENTSSSALLVDRWHWSAQTASLSAVLAVEDSCPLGSGFTLLPGEAFTLHVKPEAEGDPVWFSGGVRVRRAMREGDADAREAAPGSWGDSRWADEADEAGWEARGEYVPFGPVQLGLGLP